MGNDNSYKTLDLLPGTSVDINDSVHSFMSSGPVAILAVVWFVLASPSSSDSCDVTRMTLYANDHRNTAPICSNALSIVAHVMRWLSFLFFLKITVALLPMRVKNMLVHKLDMHQELRTGFPSPCKELVWWWGKYCPRYLHPSKVNWLQSLKRKGSRGIESTP